MTKTLLATAASFAVLAISAGAQAQTIGHIGANYARSNLDAGIGDLDVDAVEIEGAVRFDAGALGAQIDGAVTRFDTDGGDATVGALTGHLNTKLDGALLGGFAGVEHSDDATLWAVGAEGQANLGEATSLYGQLGYGQAEDLSDVDFWAGRVELRHFFTDNFKLQGSLGATRADGNGGDLDMWNAGVDAEYQFAGTQWSVLGGYEHAEIDDANLDSDTFRIGVRYTFGGTLRDRYQSGASLAPVSKLFGGTLGQGVVGALGALAD